VDAGHLEQIRISGSMSQSERANLAKAVFWCAYCDKQTDHTIEKCPSKNADLRLRRESAQLRDLCKQAGVDVSKFDNGGGGGRGRGRGGNRGGRNGNFNRSADASSACLCGRCVAAGRNPMDCFDRPENESRRPANWKTRAQRLQEQAKLALNESDSNSSADLGNAIASLCLVEGEEEELLPCFAWMAIANEEESNTSDHGDDWNTSIESDSAVTLEPSETDHNMLHNVIMRTMEDMIVERYLTEMHNTIFGTRATAVDEDPNPMYQRRYVHLDCTTCRRLSCRFQRHH
jgi:hypothetical protein